MIINNLTSGYHRDFQILKEGLMESVDMLKEMLEIFTCILKYIQINEDIFDNSIYDNLFSVEAVNKLVLNGMTFRDAYKKVGEDVLKGRFKPTNNIHYIHEGSIGNLCLDEIKQKFNNYYK